MYQYKATLLNVVDGDTVDMDVDMGFSVRIKQRLRLYGIDTPEINSKDPIERELAMQAKQFVLDQLKAGSSYTINTYKDDKYGRLLAEVFVAPFKTLNAMLIEAGLAKVYLP